MRRILSTVLIACLVSLSAFAQSLPTSSQDSKPQIAYHLFSTWADDYMSRAKRGKIVGETILYSTGALALGGAALTWYGGDEISNNVSGSPMDPMVKQNVAMGLGIGGAVLIPLWHDRPIRPDKGLSRDLCRHLPRKGSGGSGGDGGLGPALSGRQGKGEPHNVFRVRIW